MKPEKVKEKLMKMGITEAKTDELIKDKLKVYKRDKIRKILNQLEETE